MRTYTNGVFVATAAGTYQLLTSLRPESQSVSARRAPPEVQPIALAVGAKSKIVTLTWGQRLESTVVLGTRTRIALDSFSEGDRVRLLYVADSREKRYTGGTNGAQLVLPKGTYRFVFNGNGEARIALKKLKLNESIVPGDGVVFG